MKTDPIDVLNHGQIYMMDSMPSDLAADGDNRVVQAARTSLDQGLKGKVKDRALQSLIERGSCCLYNL